MGSVFSLLVMLTHFRSKKNTLRLVKPVRLLYILKYLGTDAVSVYGIIINISTFVQCCAYSIGQASQPMISTNFGAGKGKRIVQIPKYALGTAAV